MFQTNKKNITNSLLEICGRVALRSSSFRLAPWPCQLIKKFRTTAPGMNEGQVMPCKITGHEQYNCIFLIPSNLASLIDIHACEVAWVVGVSLCLSVLYFILSPIVKKVFELKQLVCDCQVPIDSIEPLFQQHVDHTSKDEPPRLLGERAVIIGGSITGLLSASTLSPYFKEVVIVERYVTLIGRSITKFKNEICRRGICGKEQTR